MGRGEYYKNKYGNKGRGRNPNDGEQSAPRSYDNGPGPKRDKPLQPSTGGELRSFLLSVDRKPYNFYKDLYGYSYNYDGVFSMRFDNVQGDPYAAPSRICVTMSLAKTRYPKAACSSRVRSTALADYICRQTVKAIADLKADIKSKGSWHDGKGGELRIEHPSENILARTSVEIRGSELLMRFCIGLPARGRSICGDWAAEICCSTVPDIVFRACCGEARDTAVVRRWCEVHEDQEALREQLHQAGLVAFVPDGAILPRAAGHLDTPLTGTGVVAFESPDSVKITMKCPNRGEVTGMGVKRGVTLIAGGGFHGKTTLLSALKMGVYPKIPGDGREYLVTTPTATKIRAEDGRQITEVDISNFIRNLPQGRDTSRFSSADASGSTSQAAAIMEYMELGGTCLMIDEDTAATNFMIRDDKIQLLLPADKEPITPFLHRARELYTRFGVSSVLVIGGAGDYLDIADTVLLLDNFVVHDVTQKARQIAEARPATLPDLPVMTPPTSRTPDLSSLAPFAGKVKVMDKSGISYCVGGAENLSNLDLSAFEQIVEMGQTRAIAEILKMLSVSRDKRALIDILKDIETDIQKQGLGCIKDDSNWLSTPRIFEIGAAINRYRELSLSN